MNVNEFISQVRSSNKAIADDNLISDRQIFNIGRTVASRLIKQEVNKRRLLNSDNIFTPIECLCLVDANLHECGINSDSMVKRSQEQLPELEEGIYGYTIQGVYNIDNSEEIYPTTNREYINLSKLRFKPNKIYYMVKNRYLYVLDKDIENVNIYVYSPDNSFELSECQSMYEAELKIPPYLKDQFYAMIDERLLNFNRSVADINDNNLERN